MSEQRNYDWNSFEYLMGMVKGFCWGKASTIWKSSKSDDDNERINAVWNLDKTINSILDDYEDIPVDTGKQIGLDVVLDCLNYFKPDDDDDDNNNWKIEKQDNKIQVSVNNAPLFLFWVEDGKVWSKDRIFADDEDEME